MIIRSEQEMLNLGKDFAKHQLEPDNSVAAVLELIGDVGAGKTTFTRGLAEGLDISEPITSPSFTISKQYALKNGGRLIHYDFYRIQDPGIMSEDLSEALQNPKNVIVIEWGESISDLLPDNHHVIKFNYTEDGREVTL